MPVILFPAFFRRYILGALWLWSGVAALWAAEPTMGSDARPFGVSTRASWTTSRVQGSPEPPAPYRLQRVFPQLKFAEPVELRQAPGTDRLFILELKGKIFSFQSPFSSATADLFFDLNQAVKGINMVYGMAFHPGFATNGYFYVCYALKDGLPDGSRVSRFTVRRSDPAHIDPGTEQVIISWLSGGHNGGCLAFGPDGCLYISTGDGAGPNPPDPLNTGQDIGDLLSSILRLDVDHAEPGKSYRVPADNPFVNVPGARPEVWAYGFRNPWKMSFDRRTGHLWVGDVGWELWEMVDRVDKGGNYGWSVVEGRQTIKPDGRRGPTPILPPVAAHPHSEAASITGGFVYHGKRIKELAGAYVYGDWATGKMWSLRYDGTQVARPRELANSTLQIICFGEDQAGEIFVVGYDGTLHQIVPQTGTHSGTDFPRRLSATGIFSSVRSHTPAPGVLAYSLNAEPWADHASAERLLALPGVGRIVRTNDGKLAFPKDAVLVKTLSVELQRGQPSSRRRVETQVLHFDGVNWNPYAYQWNEEQTDAALVGAEGSDQAWPVRDPRRPGDKSVQNWHIASRAECLRCHNSWVGFAVGFEPMQLNREHSYGRVVDNQLRTLAHLGILEESWLKESKVKLTDPYNASADLGERARSWLHENCAHCHRMHAGGAVLSELNFDQKLELAKVVGARPTQGGFGLAEPHVVTAGDPLRSVLYYRISTTGQGHMPHLGASMVDEVGRELIYEWVKRLPRVGESESAAVHSGRVARERDLELLHAAESSASSGPFVARLLESPAGALALQRELVAGSLPDGIAALLVSRAAQHQTFQTRDLFERFLPARQRVQKLGAVVQPAHILALRGDPARGRKLFFQEGGAACQQCHKVQGQGRDFGPDLSLIGRKYGRAQILEQILAPSKIIDAQYISYQLETKDDLAYAGFLVARTDAEVVLKDASGQIIRVATSRLKSLEASKLSAMPEQLLQAMTASEAADLLSYLESLR